MSDPDLLNAIGYALSCRAHLARALRCAAVGVERGDFRITDRVITLIREAIEEMMRHPGPPPPTTTPQTE